MPVNLHLGDTVPGSRGHYRVVSDESFEGGQAKGYLVEDEDRTPLFLKMFREPTLRSPQAAPFRERQRILAERLRLVPDFVCREVDFFEHRGTFYKVFERMEGTSLQQKLKTAADHADPEFWSHGDRLTNAVVLAFAIGEIHGHGIAHLDLKPDNCYLAERTIVTTGARRQVMRLLDFDGALVDGAPPPQVMGTANYWSPEHVRPHLLGAPGKHSDVFTLGIMLYQVLARRYPFVAARGFLTRATEHPRKVAPYLPSGTSEVIWQALSPSPADRPTAAEMHAALRGDTPAAAGSGSSRVAPVPESEPSAPSPCDGGSSRVRVALITGHRRIRIWKDEVIGRSTLRGIPGYEHVNQYHARVFRDASGWVICPAARTANPILMDHVLLEPGKRYPLRDGGVITIGRLSLAIRFEHDE